MSVEIVRQATGVVSAIQSLYSDGTGLVRSHKATVHIILYR